MPTNYPGAIDNFSNPTAIQQTTSPSHSTQHGNLNDAVEAIENELGADPSGASATVVARLNAHDALAGHASSSGAAFPAQPAYGNNVPFFRTDLGMEFFYNGTRWLSLTLYDAEIPPYTLPQPYTATGISHRGATPMPGALAVWIETFYAAFFVGAGTALGASHKWVAVLRSDPAATTLGTLNIDSGASSTYRTLSVAVNVVSPITEFQTRVTATKTGTPGDLNIWPRYTYRLIAT